MNLPYDQLARRVRQGDRDALAELIERKRAALLAFVQRNMSDRLLARVEAQDVLQEAVLAAMDSLGNAPLEDDRDPFSWLCQIAERRIIDAHRRYFAAQKRDGRREVRLQGAADGSGQGELLNVLVNSMTSPSAAFSRDQKESRMRRAVAALPEQSRDAVRMRYLDGLPTKEIAERLGKSDGSVRVMLSRALRKLELALSDDTWCAPGDDS